MGCLLHAKFLYSFLPAFLMSVHALAGVQEFGEAAMFALSLGFTFFNCYLLGHFVSGDAFLHHIVTADGHSLALDIEIPVVDWQDQKC